MSLLNLLRENKTEKTYDDLRNFNKTISGSGSVVRYEDSYEMPIVAQDMNSGWKTVEDPERLVKTYVFDDMKEVLYFFNELYKHQFKINHHCKITIDNLNVTVETYTHGFDGVTEQDLKIKKIADELHGDLNYFKRKNS